MAFNPYDPRLASTVQQAVPMMTGIMGGSAPQSASSGSWANAAQRVAPLFGGSTSPSTAVMRPSQPGPISQPGIDPHAGMTLKPGESGNEASDWVPSIGGTQNPWGQIPQMPQVPYDWPTYPLPPGFDPVKAAQDAQTKSPWVLPGNQQMFNQAQGHGVPGSMQQAQYGMGLMPPRSGRMVRIKLPNGMEQNVPEEHAAYYQSQGATLSGY